MKPSPLITAARAAALLSLCPVASAPANAASHSRNYVAEITPAAGSTAEPSLDTAGRVAVRYVDGMGRPVADILVGEGGDGGDIATLSEYDAAGRVSRQWAPFPTGGRDGGFPDGHGALSTAFHGDGSRPFTEIVYDMFRKDDPAETRAPGRGWDTHPARRARLGTDPADPRLRCLRLVADPDGPSLRTNGYYPKGTLRVVSDIDGDGNETLTFTDRLGRAVLTRRQAPGGGWADTYRAYDNAGDLRHILSPAASLSLRPRRPVPDSVLRKLAFYYEYDAARRVTLRRDPGVEPVYTVYDRIGNPVLSQDGCQRARGEWTVMKYDRRMRPAVAGTAVITSAPASAGSGGAATLSTAGPIGGGVIGGGVTGPVTGDVATGLRHALAAAYADSLLIEDPIHGAQLEHTLQYTCRSGPRGFTPFRSWHYDTYAVWDSVWPPDPREVPLSGGAFPPTGLPTVEMYISEPYGRPHIRGFAYDHAGRLTATATRDVYSDTYSHSETLTLDFNGRVTRREAVARLMAEKTTVERHSAVWGYVYDRAGRVTRSTLSVDGGPEVTAAACSYDQAGRPASSGSGGTALQRFDAAYDGNALVSLNDDSDGALPPGTSSFPPGYYPPGSFTRDALGRLTRDSTRSVVSVAYDPRCGLPASVKAASGERVLSAYLPDGTLLSRKLLTPRVTVTTTVNAKGDTIVRTRRDNIRDTEARYGAFTRRRDTRGAVTWRLDHDAGAAIVANDGAVTHLFHLRDRLGSTRVVFGMDGAPLQSVGYFPDGAPVILGPSERLTDRLREGMPFIDHAGLGAYDNSARWLDAVGGSFWQPDPKAASYPGFSPYANRGCNPTRYLDPSGEDCLPEFNDESIDVHADFYALESDYGLSDALRRAAETIRRQSGRWALQFKHNGEIVNLPINFQLSTYELPKIEGMEAIKNINYSLPLDKDDRRTNGVILMSDSEKHNTNGNSGNRLIQIKSYRMLTLTLPHEMGHILGMWHSNNGLMTESASDPYRSGDLSRQSIEQLIKTAIKSLVSGEGVSYENAGVVYSVMKSTQYDVEDLNKFKIVRIK